VLGAVSGLGVGLATDIIDFKRSASQPADSKNQNHSVKTENSLSKPTSEGAALSAAMAAEKLSKNAQTSERNAASNDRTFAKYKKYGRGRRLLANIATHVGRGMITNALTIERFLVA